MSKTRRKIVAIVRRWWRQLTSMRTALVLLLILALAAVPGSLLPQRNLNIEQVRRYFEENPDLAPVLDRLWGFDVYSSPWFAAIYLLLFTSLVGCLLPRLREFITSLRTPPPDAPARMSILPQYRESDDRADAEEAARILRKDRFRVSVRDRGDSVMIAAEKGYSREAGNLLFHFSLIGLLVGMAFGSLYGWYGNRILVAGEDGAFCNTLQQYDEYGLGANVTSTDLPPFCLQLDEFTAVFLENGQPTQFIADLQYGQNGQIPSEEYRLEVNHPLELDGATVFLLGHGYAPVISYTDRYGTTQTSTTAFLAEDGMLTSTGAAVFPDANVDPETGQPDPNAQIAFEGIFMPTVPEQPPFTTSVAPELNNPGLMLVGYRGDTGLDDGQPQSVYSVNAEQIADGSLEVIDVDPKVLAIGESWQLDDGTSVTFEGILPYAVLQVRDDPGELTVLAFAITVLMGLLPALTVRRRRFWVRIGPDGTEFGGLARTEFDGFGEEFDRLADTISGVDRSEQPEKIGSLSQ
ncbi:cytochrome c biogenesis protein [Stackebrandtia endophytica]|uniref:Cytochrome c biogenesis protein n=1 Tax=Stackebrandtia endophytica TaxID=1496996 RepID=A0A543AZB7_9ACTN|nr:cytochrome c biogenesis protein ResB [Stackebrandtia endophytica]TQL77925.1 cytochrome c biogenesis protein [Stackebrandtia endophytica]